MDSKPTNPSSASEAKPKKLNAQRTKARNDFKKPTGPLMELDIEFDSYKATERGNVDIVLQQSLPDRLSQPYTAAVERYAIVKPMADAEKALISADTKAMVTLSVARKLLISIPQSQAREVASLGFFLANPYFVPPNLWTLIANLGKFDLDDYVVRYPYAGQDIHRLVLKALKDYNGRRGFDHFRGVLVVEPHLADPILPWGQVNPDLIVWPIDSSTKWIIDQSKQLVSDFLRIDFPIQIGGVDIWMSYPYLDTAGSRNDVLARLAVWIPKLIDNVHPDRERAIHAAICTVWDTRWTKQATRTFVELGVNLPGFPDLCPYEVLATFGINIVDERNVDDDTSIDYLEKVLSTLNDRQNVFNDIFEMRRMPDDEKFGTTAQLAPIGSDYLQRTHDPDTNQEYYRLKNNVVSNVYHKYADTASVVAGMIMGITSKVDFHPEYEARLRMNPAPLLNQTVQPDFKKLR